MPALAQDLTSINFTTPSKNIDCLMFDFNETAAASCVVKSASWKKLPAKPADCDLDWSATEIGITSEKSGSTFKNSLNAGTCRGDIGPLCGPTCLVLGYGKSRTFRNITCTSAKAGVTCRTTSGPKKGFTVSRAGYTVL